MIVSFLNVICVKDVTEFSLDSFFSWESEVNSERQTLSSSFQLPFQEYDSPHKDPFLCYVRKPSSSCLDGSAVFWFAMGQQLVLWRRLALVKRLWVFVLRALTHKISVSKLRIVRTRPCVFARFFFEFCSSNRQIKNKIWCFVSFHSQAQLGGEVMIISRTFDVRSSLSHSSICDEIRAWRRFSGLYA